MDKTTVNTQHGKNGKRFRAVVLGVSTGGVDALKRLLPALPAAYSLPVLVVIHMAPGSGDGLAKLLDELAEIHVKEADEGEFIKAGVVYLAPANYHLLLESNGQLALSIDTVVNFARPAIDVLFESAAASFGSALIGVILTGAANDGARGLERIRQLGGYTIVQDPADALMDSMPRNALAHADRVVRLDELPALLTYLEGVSVADNLNRETSASANGASSETEKP
ncbi:MAG: chemotaxis protein CheB [Pseudomonadota bacterium]